MGKNGASGRGRADAVMAPTAEENALMQRLRTPVGAGRARIVLELEGDVLDSALRAARRRRTTLARLVADGLRAAGRS